MKKKLAFITTFIFLTAIPSFASCVVEMEKSHYVEREKDVTLSHQKGYFEEYIDLVEAKGYEVCVGETCEDKNVKFKFSVATVVAIEKNWFGWDKADFYTVVTTKIDGNMKTETFEIDDFEDVHPTASTYFSSLFPDCSSEENKKL